MEMVKEPVQWRSASSSRFSAALGNMSKLYFLTFSAALGIARTSSALRSLARKFQADRPQRNRFAHELHECNEGTGVLQNAPTQRLTPESIKAFILLWIEAAFTQNFTPKNYTYPSLEGITG